MSEPEISLFTRIGVSLTGAPGSSIELRPYPQICHRGVVRPSVIALLVDMGAGFAAEAGAGSDWIFTTDLSIRCPSRYVPDVALGEGRPLRTGRTLITSEVPLEVAGESYAYGVASFTRVARRHGDPEKPHIHERPIYAERPPLDEPFADAVGIEVTDASRGRAQVELRDALMNPAGVMQGAIVALLAEVAAEALADEICGAPQIVTDIDVRYLAMGRVGPITAETVAVGAPEAGSGSFRVHLRDRGNGDRITAAVLVRCAPAPGA